MSTISQKRKDLLGPKLDPQSYALGKLDAAFKQDSKNFDSRVLSAALGQDPTLWHKTRPA